MIISFETFNESVNFLYLVDKDEREYFIEEMDQKTLNNIFKIPKSFSDKERGYVLLYTKGASTFKTKSMSFTYSPIKNLTFTIDKYLIRHDGGDHSMYVLKVNKEGVNSMYYSSNMVSCLRKVDEMKKTMKKGFRNWI